MEIIQAFIQTILNILLLWLKISLVASGIFVLFCMVAACDSEKRN